MQILSRSRFLATAPLAIEERAVGLFPAGSGQLRRVIALRHLAHLALGD